MVLIPYWYLYLTSTVLVASVPVHYQEGTNTSTCTNQECTSTIMEHVPLLATLYQYPFSSGIAMPGSCSVVVPILYLYPTDTYTGNGTGTSTGTCRTPIPYQYLHQYPFIPGIVPSQYPYCVRTLAGQFGTCTVSYQSGPAKALTFFYIFFTLLFK